MILLFLRAAATALLLSLSLVVSPASAQSDVLQVNDVDDSDYPIVEVSVTVPEALAEVPLSKESFEVVEDGRRVQPYLGGAEEVEEPPAPNVVLAIDTSGSMGDDIEQVKDAADTFVTSLPPESQVAVVTFGDRPEVLVDQTGELEAVRTRIAGISIEGRPKTALNAGVQQAAELLNIEEGAPAAVVVLADGDNNVAGSTEAARAAVERHEAQLWAISLGDSVDRSRLVTLAGAESRVLSAANVGDLERVYAGLASNLARQYRLRYDSEADGDTELLVSLDAGTIQSQERVEATITAAPAGGGADEAPAAIADARTTVVTVPLLGTVAAYITGIAALAAGAFMLLTIMLAPKPIDPRARLIISGLQAGEPAGARLTSLAQWTTDATERRLRRGNLGTRLDGALERAGLNMRPGELVVMVISMMVVFLALGVAAGSILIGMALAFLVPLFARLWMGLRRDKRQAAFADQLTEVLQLIASSLRAGYGLTQGIDAVSRDTEEPAASEFRRIVVEHRLGRDLNDAMNNCAVRMDNADFSWVVQAIRIHREVGGDLAKVLDNIIATIRDRADVHRQVRSLSAEGKLSARMLITLPILVLGYLLLTNPEYLEPMTSNPLGWVMFAAAGLMMMIGMFVIRRIAVIRY